MTSSSWSEHKLGDLIQINPDALNKTYPYSEIEYLDISSVGTGFYTEVRRLKLEEAPSRAKRLVSDGDTIISTVRPGNKSYCYLKKTTPRMVVSTGFAVLRAKKDLLDERFLYYLVSNPAFTEYLVAHEKGAAYPAVGTETIENAIVNIPDLPTQKKISDILGSLDDKIELNRRMNETLEQMAMAVYKHWFVDFGPFQDGEFVESEIGLIPRVYECLSYKEIVDFCLGGDWGKDIPNSDENVGVNVIRGADFTVINSGSQFSLPVRYIKKSSFEKRKVKDMDIIIENSVNASSRTTGQSLLITRELLDFIGENTIPASFCKLFRLKRPNLSPIVYMHLKFLYESGDMEQYQNVSSNGIGNFQATQFLENQKIVLPVGDSCNQVLSSISDLLSQIAKNNKESFYLSITRDYLLPRLLSGEIEVREAEEHVEEVLANG